MGQFLSNCCDTNGDDSGEGSGGDRDGLLYDEVYRPNVSPVQGGGEVEFGINSRINDGGGGSGVPDGPGSLVATSVTSGIHLEQRQREEDDALNNVLDIMSKQFVDIEGRIMILSYFLLLIKYR